MIATLIEWVCGFFTYIMGWVVDFLLYVFSSILSVFGALMPSLSGIDTATLAPYFSIVNAWLPVDFGFALLVVYLTVEVIVLIYRTVKKHIPTEA